MARNKSKIKSVDGVDFIHQKNGADKFIQASMTGSGLIVGSITRRSRGYGGKDFIVEGIEACPRIYHSFQTAKAAIVEKYGLSALRDYHLDLSKEPAYKPQQINMPRSRPQQPESGEWAVCENLDRSTDDYDSVIVEYLDKDTDKQQTANIALVYHADNAAIIAAAPEMKKLLIAVEDYLRDNAPHGKLHTAVSDILNQLEGK